MSSLPMAGSTRRLLDAVKRLETTLRTAGLPRFMARLPVCWLCWHYCRTLDAKMARMRRIAGKFEQWLPAVRRYSSDGQTRMELIDLDRCMRNDIEITRGTMWELRSHCIDVASMFEQLGYHSPGLKRRHAAFMRILEQSCATASALQAALTAHDSAALALLRAEAANSTHSAHSATPAAAAAPIT